MATGRTVQPGGPRVGDPRSRLLGFTHFWRYSTVHHHTDQTRFQCTFRWILLQNPQYRHH